jgi:hypothetical protein
MPVPSPHTMLIPIYKIYFAKFNITRPKFHVLDKAEIQDAEITKQENPPDSFIPFARWRTNHTRTMSNMKRNENHGCFVCL